MTPASAQRPCVIALVGPSGSGKSRLGVAMAQALDTEIISVDSMAVYRGMDIGTAKPAPQERGGIVHHLLDVLEPDQPFTAADFVRLAGPIIAELHARGRPTVLVGGTGLYLRTLLHGIFEGPGPDQALRTRLLEEAAQAEAAGGEHPLHARLQTVDPVIAARLHPNDQVRILRALEVFYTTQRPLSAWQQEHAFASSPYHWAKLAIELPRDQLYARIDARVLEMVDAGLEQEVRGLLQRFGAEIKPMKGLGYLHFAQYLAGERSIDQTILTLQRDTRRFARRQLTWFKGERGVLWVPPDLASLLDLARKCVENRLIIG